MFFMSGVSHAFASVHWCLVVTCWERADLFAPDYDVYCICVTFPCGILGHVWYLMVSIPDICRLSYFKSCERNSLLKVYGKTFTGLGPAGWFQNSKEN